MKDVVAYAVAHHGYSERRACLLTRQHRSTQRKLTARGPRLEIRQRMHEIVRTRIRCGYWCVHDQLGNGQKFRAPTAVDVFSREDLAIEVGQGQWGEHIVEVLNRPVRQREAPTYLFAGNGAEFAGHLVDLWACHHGTRIDFSQPGRPAGNAFIETFNGSLRDDCLNLHWF